MVAAATSGRNPNRALRSDRVVNARERAILKSDFADERIRYARENEISQIVIGHSSRSRWQNLLRGDILGRLTRELRTIDILIVTEAADG